MPLLNYTTTVPAVRSIAEITRRLVEHGATQVLQDYADGRVVGLAFALPTPRGVQQYRLPVNVSAVETVLSAYRSGVPPRYQTTEQAERVAWRILKDWVEAQLAIVATRMVTVDQVLLPYMLMDGETVYDRYLTAQLALTAGVSDG